MGMQIKKYQAATLQKAIEQVRSDLGDGALILQADPLPNSNLGRNAVEVTAAIDRKNLTPRFEATIGNENEERDLAQSKSPEQSGFLGGIFKKVKGRANEQEIVSPKAILKPKVSPAATVDKAPSIKYSKAGKSPTPQSSGGASTGQFYAMKTMLEPLQKEMKDLREKLLEEKRSKSERAPSVALLESEIQSLKKSLQHFIAEKKFEGSRMNDEARKLISFWKEKGMSDRQIYSFLFQLKEEGTRFDQIDIQGQLKGYLKKRILEGRNLEASKKKIISLVGPTGVGKTTSIVKIAAFEKLRLHRDVAFITIDDYKIGGTDQLAHYARILEVPFVKVRSDLSLEDQIKHLSCDTVFVDTFGVSPRDERKLLALRRELAFKDPELRGRQEIHLTLPTHIQQNDVELVLESFQRLSPDYLIFTKWDETQNWGGMLATILASQIPVSFVSNGQEVPDDITTFSVQNFVDQILDISTE